MNRWKSKVQALIRLAEDQEGKPEGELAREKLRLILEKYPEARQYQPVREFMLKDVGYMKRHGIPTEGSWTGGNLQEAIALMVADYRRRIAEHKGKDWESLIDLTEDYCFLTGISVGEPLGTIHD
jgi:hypothetical protein